MRILIVHNSYQIAGGEDSVVNDEVRLLREKGVVCELFSVSNDEIDSVAAKVKAALNVVYNVSARQAVGRAIRAMRPDVVHVHNFFPLLSPSIFDACRQAAVPAVMTLHNFRLLSPSALLYQGDSAHARNLQQACWWTVPKRVYRNSLPATFAVAAMVEFHKRAGTWSHKVDRFIALSEWARTKFIEGGLPADRIVVKPNAVSPPLNHPQSRRRGGLFVGRLDEQKGIRCLLSAWQHLRYPLRIIGEGPLAPLVREAAGTHITYFGPQPREVIQEEMLAAEFLVLPSIGHEMLPLTIIEAFAAKLPVICSDLPAIGSLLEHERTGFTFPTGDPLALARLVRWASRRPQRLAEVADRAFRQYRTRYSPETNFAALMNIYELVGSEKPLRSSFIQTT